MKIGIVTWTTYYNYGTALQNVALQYTLRKYTDNVATISDRDIILSGSAKKSLFKRIYNRLHAESKLGISGVIKKYTNRDKQNSLDDGFRKFYQSRINLDSRDVEEIYGDYDVVVCGSDQIWAPYSHVTPLYYSHFFLSNFNSKKVAYAPSIGALANDQNVFNLVSPWLKEFRGISCREAAGAKFLSDALNRQVPVVADPTLLLTEQEWKSLFNLRKDDCEPYVLCYLLTYNKAYLKLIKQYALVNNMRLKVIVTDPRLISSKYECLYPTPEEFLNLIYNAEKVFTDSFHGSIFSIQFKRDFTTFKRFVDNKFNNQNERIRSLFDRLGILQRFVDTTDYSPLDDNRELDYEAVDAKLSVFREDSLSYLRNNLS